MRTTFFSIIIALLISETLIAQVDTTQSLSLLNEVLTENNDNMVLLPENFLFTQKILWGNNGLMRNLKYFKLTPLNRQNELKIRRIMLVSHQALGFATLGGMVAQAIVGTQLYNGNIKLKDTHEIIAAGVNFGYFTTAGLSLLAPPKMVKERKGFSSIKLHKALAIIHLTSMITTNILANLIEGNPNLRPYHKAAAFTAFGSYAAAMIAIKF
ncbi:MAG: hypothetical protein GXO79_04270 [Chlorobi bacterium]|nr:hypothetical protein [Chlorobiota bacterium]